MPSGGKKTGTFKELKFSIVVNIEMLSPGVSSRFRFNQWVPVLLLASSLCCFSAWVHSAFSLLCPNSHPKPTGSVVPSLFEVPWGLFYVLVSLPCCCFWRLLVTPLSLDLGVTFISLLFLFLLAFLSSLFPTHQQCARIVFDLISAFLSLCLSL